MTGITLTVKYPTKKVIIDLPDLQGCVRIEDIAEAGARVLTKHFSAYMKGLTTKSKEKYYFAQYCLIKKQLEVKYHV